MEKLKIEDVKKYVEENIGEFHESRIKSLKELKLSKILLKKNPYLFKAKNILTAEKFVESLVQAYISSQEETLFGSFLEKLAIFVCNKSYRGKKSSAEGLDLEFEKDSIIYIVTVKSGTNWGNADQVAKMKENFRKAKQRLRSNAKRRPIEAINGCCYGRVIKTDKGEYQKIAGQKFWTFISGNDYLYTDIIEPLSYKAKERSKEYEIEYSKQINIFSLQFAKEFCENGLINWNKIVQFNSGEKKIKVDI